MSAAHGRRFRLHLGIRGPGEGRALRGERGIEGAAGWLRLQGEIQPDGSAKLDAKGVTGDPKFSVKGAQFGVPYFYQVAARFEGSRGTGRRMQARACDLTFVKQ